ncbi:ALP1-like protein [Tanacetum coccineum]
MSRTLFTRIVKELSLPSTLFCNKRDFTGREGFSPLMKANNDINVVINPLYSTISEKEKHQRIYPEWSTFVETISNISKDDHKRIRYKRMQDASRKDVEWTFGPLKKK